MLVKTGLKVQLLPNNKQETRFFQFAGAARFAYNWALAKEMQSFVEGEKFISAKKLRKEFTILRHTEGSRWLEKISNDVTKQAIKDCTKNYLDFLTLQKTTGVRYTKKKLAHLARIGKKPTLYDMYGHPKFHTKKEGYYHFYQDTAKIKFSSTHVKLQFLTGCKRKNRRKFNWVRLAERDRIPVNGNYMNPRVTYDGEHWWLSVTVERNLPEPTGIYTDSLGIDLGIKDIAICSDGTKYKNINKTETIKKLKKRRRRLQRQISRKYRMVNPAPQKGVSYKKSNNIKKAEKQLLRINHRLTHLRKNYLHQTTSKIIKRKPSLICLEDLNIQGMLQNKYLAKWVQEAKLFEFRRQIEYKAAKAGIPVIIADRFFPSSKTCSHCGYIHKGLKLNDRTYCCPACGQTIDRDLQAALNLKHYGEIQIALQYAK